MSIIKMKILLLVLLFALLSFFVPMKSNYNEGIPKIIHQTAMADKTKWNPIWEKCQQSWKDKFPDFEYRMWHDEDLDEFMKTNYPDFYQNVYSKYDKNIKKIDAARYFILYEFGGMYADMDFECKKNFWDQIPQDKVSIAESATQGEQYQNALMITPKSNPFWLDVIEQLKKNKDIPDPIYATGPFIIIDSTKRFDINPLDKKLYSVIGGRDTIYFSSKITEPSDDVYCIHHGTCSWC